MMRRSKSQPFAPAARGLFSSAKQAVELAARRADAARDAGPGHRRQPEFGGKFEHVACGATGNLKQRVEHPVARRASDCERAGLGGACGQLYKQSFSLL